MMRFGRIFILGLGCVGLTLFGCRRPAKTLTIETTPDPCSSTGEYFPASNAKWMGTGLSYNDIGQGEMERRNLQLMHEPSLYACQQTSDVTYRFLWKRSFSPTISARLVVHPSGEGVLFLRMLKNGSMLPPPQAQHPFSKEGGDEEFYRVIMDRQIAVSHHQIEQAQRLFDPIDFWNQVGKPGMDGSDSIVEFSGHGRYRLGDFWNAGNPQARAFGLYLIQEIAEIRLNNDEIY